MRKVMHIMAAALLLAACSPSGERFEISGRLDGITTDTTLVFEALTLKGSVTLDSVRLKAGKSTFTFTAARPTNPEFYRLRVGYESLNVCIDSTESVCINATLGRMATGYTVEGSEKCEQLRQLALAQQVLRTEVNAILNRDGMSPSQREEAVMARIEAYKKELVEKFVAPDPASAVAYSALFQTFNGQLIFNPVTNRQDVKWMAAAATSWDLLYPGTERTENLHNVALKGLAMTSNAANRDIEITSDKIHETGIIDISLPDANHQERRLSDLAGKVVLLDFTAYALPENAERQLLLREMYGKYKAQGFEVYQVSVDADRHFWSTRAEQLPWVCVHCDEGLEADILRLYNVQGLPMFFLIDRSSTLQVRGDMTDDIEAEIKKLL